MDGPSVLAYGVLIPAVIAGIVLLVAARRARAAPARPEPVAGALAFGAGFLATQSLLAGVPPWIFGEDSLGTLGKLFWAAVAAIVLAPLRSLPVIGRFGNGFYVAFFAILPYHLLRRTDADTPAFDVLGFGSVFVVYAIWVALERLAARRPGPSVPIALWGACAGTALVFVLNKSALQAQLTGALAAALGAAAVVALLVRGAHLASGAIAILALVVGTLVRQAHGYGLPDAAWLGIALSFVGPWLGEIPTLRARSPLLAGAVAFLGALVPAAAAAWFTHAAKAAASPYGY